MILGATVVYFRRRAGTKGTRDTGLTIVRRTTVGLRSELLVVSVEGQRLLLGVTPHSIQSIAILDAESAAPVTENLGDRFAGIIEAAEREPASELNPLRPRPTPRLPEPDGDDADQAVGLRALRRGR